MTNYRGRIIAISRVSSQRATSSSWNTAYGTAYVVEVIDKVAVVPWIACQSRSSAAEFGEL